MAELKQSQSRQANPRGPNRPRVFVYGTLKQGEANHHLMDGTTYLGESVVRGPFMLADFGWYPGVVRTDGKDPGVVHGEVYEVTDEVLHSLDILEGHPAFYERVKVGTDFKNAWMYTLPAAFAGKRDAITGGSWHGKEEE